MFCKNKENKLLYVSFNQDASYFIIGTQNGFSIYNTLTLQLVRQRNIYVNIRIAELLHQTNIVLLSGDDRSGEWANSKLRVWDDSLDDGTVVAELEFRSEVQSVKVKRDRLVVAIDTKVFVFNLIDLKLLAIIDRSMPDAPISISTSINSTILAVAELSGRVNLYKLHTLKQEDSPDKSLQESLKPHQTITATRNHEIRHLVLDTDGNMLAVTSTNGTVIHLYDLRKQGSALEFRRGNTTAHVHCIAFNHDCTLVAVATDHAHVHIFSLKNESQSGWFSSFSSYIGTGAVCQIEVPDLAKICSFVGTDNTLVILSSSGNYYRFGISRSSSEPNGWKAEAKLANQPVSFLQIHDK